MSGALLAGAALTAWLACAALALSQDRHWQTVTGQRQASPRTARPIGWLLLLISLTLCVLRDGGSFAALLWPLLLAAAALATAALLTWRPVWLRPLAMLLR